MNRQNLYLLDDTKFNVSYNGFKRLKEAGIDAQGVPRILSPFPSATGVTALISA